MVKIVFLMAAWLNNYEALIKHIGLVKHWMINHISTAIFGYF